MASTLSASVLLDEVKESTRHISDLVAAMKSYSQLDRAAMQETDLVEGLESTLMMLAHRPPPTGAGMSPEVQQHAFDPVYTTKGVGEGTGLGLDISRRIVDRHNGDISVRTRPGETILRVRLPTSHGRR